jgi:hypothetical protein
MKFGPLCEIYTVSVGVVAGALDCKYFIGILVHFLEIS